MHVIFQKSLTTMASNHSQLIRKMLSRTKHDIRVEITNMIPINMTTAFDFQSQELNTVSPPSKTADRPKNVPSL